MLWWFEKWDLQLTSIRVCLHHWAPACMSYWSSSCCFFCSMFFFRMNYINRFGDLKIVHAKFSDKDKGQLLRWSQPWVVDWCQLNSHSDWPRVRAQQPSKAICGCMQYLSTHHISSLFRLNAHTQLVLLLLRHNAHAKSFTDTRRSRKGCVSWVHA